MTGKLQKYFDFNVMYDVAIIEAYTSTFENFRRYLGEAEDTVLMIGQGTGGGDFNFQGKFLTFHDPAAIERVGRAIYGLIRDDRRWRRLQALLRSYDQHLFPYMTLEGTERLTDGLTKDSDFLAAYERWHRAYVECATAYLFTDGYYHEFSIREAQEELAAEGRDAADIAELLKPRGLSEFQKADQELARIGALRNSGDEQWRSEFRVFLDRYVWLYVADTHYNLPEIIKQLEARLATPGEGDVPHTGAHDALRDVPAQPSGVIGKLGELGFQRIQMRRYWQWLDFLLHRIFARFEEKYGLPLYFLAMLTNEETVSLMRGYSESRRGNLERRQEKRVQQFAALLENGTVRVYDDRQSIEGIRKIHCEDETQRDFLTGQIAYRGEGAISGRARVVKWTQQIREELIRIEPGEIIVLNQIKPDFLPFLQRVKAIVADEGGITSHSAIISRELKIPSIIGTRNATSFVQDGDELHLDFTAGTVRVR